MNACSTPESIIYIFTEIGLYDSQPSQEERGWDTQKQTQKPMIARARKEMCECSGEQGVDK